MIETKIGSNAPIIVIGMHRSGTSIVSELLEGMGCFIGWRKPHHHEPSFINQLNEWLLSQAGASWDNPSAINFLLDADEIRPLVADYMALQLKSPRAISYWGPYYLRYLTSGKCPLLWGWKDPRNTFTLPVWLDLFPDAKVIHVLRHGIDVAQSLVVRHEKIFAAKKKLFEGYGLIYAIRPKQSGFTDTIRGKTLKGAFSIWEEYVDQARQHVTHIGRNAIEIRYEDLLADPLTVLTKLAKFSEIDISNDKLEDLVATLRPTRGFAYRQTEELSNAAREFQEALSVRGYSA